QRRNGEALAARESWQTALQINPQDALAASNLARLLLLGPDEVRDARRVAPLVAVIVSRVPADRAAQAWRGLAEIRQGRFEQGLQSLAELTSHDPNDHLAAIVAYGKAVAHASLGDEAAARRDLDDAQTLRESQLPTLTPDARDDLDRLRSEALSALE